MFAKSLRALTSACILAAAANTGHAYTVPSSECPNEYPGCNCIYELTKCTIFPRCERSDDANFTITNAGTPGVKTGQTGNCDSCGQCNDEVPSPGPDCRGQVSISYTDSVTVTGTVGGAGPGLLTKAEIAFGTTHGNTVNFSQFCGVAGFPVCAKAYPHYTSYMNTTTNMIAVIKANYHWVVDFHNVWPYTCEANDYALGQPGSAGTATIATATGSKGGSGACVTHANQACQ